MLKRERQVRRLGHSPWFCLLPASRPVFTLKYVSPAPGTHCRWHARMHSKRTSRGVSDPVRRPLAFRERFHLFPVVSRRPPAETPPLSAQEYVGRIVLGMPYAHTIIYGSLKLMSMRTQIQAARPCRKDTCNICSICQQGFELGETYGRYGKGVYFSSAIEKAGQYANGSTKVGTVGVACVGRLCILFRQPQTLRHLQLL